MSNEITILHLEGERYWVKGFEERMANNTATYEEQTIQNLLDRWADGEITL